MIYRPVQDKPAGCKLLFTHRRPRALEVWWKEIVGGRGEGRRREIELGKPRMRSIEPIIGGGLSLSSPFCASFRFLLLDSIGDRLL